MDCRVSIEFQPPTLEAVKKVPASVTTFSVTCEACHRNFDPPGAPKLLREVRSQGTRDSKGEQGPKRLIGTDEHPIDMSLYVESDSPNQLRYSWRASLCDASRY